MISAFIFLLVFGVGVWAVSRAFNMHAEASVQQSLQREVQAISAFMEEDASKTNFFRTANQSLSNADGERRDGFGMVAMESWQGTVPLDVLGLPAWDNFISYTTTLEKSGIMRRQIVRPAAVPIQDSEVFSILGSVLGGTLNAGDTLINEKILSSSVAEFVVSPDARLGQLMCELKLRETTAQTDGLGGQKEILEVRILLYPQNTWPIL